MRMNRGSGPKRGMPWMRLRFQFAAGVLASIAVVGPARAQSAGSSGIAHVALRVSDLEKSRAFYQKLGFEQAFEFSEGGKVTQSFIKINDRQFIELYPRNEESQAIGLMHVCYESTDIAPLRELLVERSVDPTEVRKARAGNLLFVLRDPENQVVEYTQYLPGSLHSEDRGKHLGPNRFVEHLGSVLIPVKSGKAEQDFYAEKLGFSKGNPAEDPRRMKVPGSTDSVELAESGESVTRLHFLVKNWKDARQGLREAGMASSEDHGAMVVTDPDGNQVVLDPPLAGSR